MRRTRQQAPGRYSALARSILAAALLLCALSNALPAGAALNPKGAMPCCRGMKGRDGECHGNSCPMHLRPSAKSPKIVRRDPVCGAGRLLQATVKTPLTAPQDYFDQEHSHDHDGSNTPQRQPSAGAAALGKPCPSDCCGGVTGYFNGLRRPKQAAALTDNLRPRPPTVELYKYTPSGLLKVMSVLRRSHPPRAPPFGLHSRTT